MGSTGFSSLTLYNSEAIIVPHPRGERAGLQPAQSSPHCTKCNSPPINGQCTNHCIVV